MEEQLKKEMIIVEENPLFKYIKGIFELIKGNGNSVLYLTDEGLYCKTYFICEKLEIQTRNAQSLFNELESNKEYELYMLPGKKYKLTLKKENLASEETVKSIIDCHKNLKFICDIEPNEFGAISKIAINSRYCMSDDYAKSIKKFGSCEAYLNGNGRFIVLQKKESKEEIYCRISEAYYSCSLEELEAERRANKN